MNTHPDNKPKDSKSATSIFSVDCPTCKKKVAWCAESPYRPFCSERCKLIDLGAWASGDYALPVNDPMMNVDEFDLGDEVNASPKDDI